MLPFKPNKEYKTISLYVGAVLAIIITMVLFLIRISSIRAWLAPFLGSLTPILLGAVFAYLLRPLMRRLEILFRHCIKKEGLVKLIAITLSLLAVGVILFLFFAYVLPALLGDTGALGQKLSQLLGKIEDILFRIVEIFHLPADTFSNISSWVYSAFDAITAFAIRFATAFLGAIYDIVIGVFLSAAFLYHRDSISAAARRSCIALFPTKVCRFLSRVITYSDHTFGKYLIGKLVEAMIVGVIYLIILPLIGMPYPYLITVIMVITNFIPIIGGFLGGIPCGLLVLTENPIMALWFVVICLLMEQIDGNIIIPKLIGSILGLRAVCIIVAVALFGGLFGILGMFLAAPVFSILYMIIQEAVNNRLTRKGKPLDHDSYATLFAAQAPRRKVHLWHPGHDHDKKEQ